MADRSSAAASVLAIAMAATTSVRSLHDTVDGFQSRNRTLGRLQDKLQDLATVLDSLIQVTNADASVLVLLESPIGRCKEICNEFEQSVKEFHGKTETGLLDWTKLESMTGDIDGFIDTIEGYKSTIIVGLGTINLRHSKISHQVLQQYEEMVKDTAYNLEVLLRQTDDKLTRRYGQGVTATDTSVDLRDERAVTQQCLRVCQDASTYLETLATRESPLLQHASQIDARDDAGNDFKARVLTRQALDASQATLLGAVNCLEERLQSVVQNKGNDDEQKELKLQEDLDVSEQGLQLCKVVSGVSHGTTHGVGEAPAEDDSDQTVVTTLAGLFDATEAVSRGRSASLVAGPTPETFAAVAQRRYDSRFAALSDRPVHSPTDSTISPISRDPHDAESSVPLGTGQDAQSFVDSGIAMSEQTHPYKQGERSVSPSEADRTDLGEMPLTSDSRERVPPNSEDIASRKAYDRSAPVVAAEDYLLSCLLSRNDLLVGLQHLQEGVRFSDLRKDVTELLKLYFLDLRDLASTRLEHASADLMRKHWYRARVATHLVKSFSDENYTGELTDEDSDQRERSTMSRDDLEAWLGRNAAFADRGGLLAPSDTQIPNEADNTDPANTNYDDELGSENEESYEEPGFTEQMTRFMLDGRAFDNLLENVYSRSIKIRHLDLRDRLMSLPASDIHFHFPENTSWFDNVRHCVEKASVAQWNWWPLPPPRRAIYDDCCRIAWTCYCHTQHYQDVPVKDARMLQRLIQSRGAVAKGDHPCFKRSLQAHHAPGRIARLKLFFFQFLPNLFLLIATVVVRGLDVLSTAIADPSASRPRSSSPGSSPRCSSTSLSPKGSSTDPDSVPSCHSTNLNRVVCGASNRTALVVPICDESRLLLGLKEKWNIGIDQIDLKNQVVKHDGDFMKALRRSYCSLRGFWRCWFSVYQLKTMEYRHFYKQRCNFVSRGDVDRPLPEHIPDYEYRTGETVPPDHRRPPIPQDEFYCCLNLCSQPCWWVCVPWHLCNPPPDELTMVDRVPKKKSLWELQVKGHDSAWGLECKIEISFMRNLLYHAIMILGVVAFWGWWQGSHPADLQNATAPLTVLTGLFSLYWTSIGALRTLE